MVCQKGGYIHHRHNEIRDLFIKLAEEISNDVECEPLLQALSGEQLPPSTNITDKARLDLSVRSFWHRGQFLMFGFLTLLLLPTKTKECRAC